MNKRIVFKLILGFSILVIVLGGIFLLNRKFKFLADTSPEWEIFPNNSESNPMISQWMSIEINSTTPNAKFYKVVSDDISFIQPWISRTGDQVQVDAGVNGIGKMRLRLVAYDNKDGNILKEYQNTIDAYYDYSFGTLSTNFEISAESYNNGDVKLVAKPKNPSDPQLAKIQNYRWSFADLDEGKYWGNYSSKPELIIPINQPGPLYIGFAPVGEPTYDRHGYYQPQQPAVIRMVVNVRKEDGSLSRVRTFSDNVYVANSIKGDVKLPVISDSITMFSGGSLAIPINLREFPTEIDPSSIEIELPKGVVLNTVSGAIVDFREVQSLETDYTRFRITKKTGKEWGTVATIYPTFPSEMIGCPFLKIRVRAVASDNALSRNDNWQELPLSLQALPSAKLPKRLVTSFTWAKAQSLFYSPNGSIDAFLNIYKNLGFNTVPNIYINQDNPQTSTRLYSPEQRSGNLWQNLQYGPESHLFSSNYFGSKKGFYDLKLSEYGTNLTEADVSRIADTFFAENFSFEEPRLTEEKNKWINAIKYNLETGKIDMAYDGALLENDLLAINNQMTISKPEYIFLDCEGFPDYNSYVSTIHQSANAQVRRLPGESDVALAERIVDEFTSKFVNAIRKNSPSTKISLYNEWAVGKGNKLIDGRLLRKNDIISAPSLYAEGTSLPILAAAVRANRLVTPRDKELIPWLSLGTYAFKRADSLFDEVVHTLLNGASGISLYTDKDIDDMNDLLNISKAIDVVAPYEDIILDGKNALGEVSDIKNAFISVVRLDDRYLLAVTPKNNSDKVEFKLSTQNKKYQFINLNGEHKKFSFAKALNFSDVLPSTMVALISVDTEAPKIVHLNVDEGEKISFNPYIIYARLENPYSISRVEFYVDDVLIGVSTLPDVDGGFEVAWDTSKYQSTVKVVAYDLNGNQTEITRNTTVLVKKNSGPTSPIVSILPRTGFESLKIENYNRLLKYPF